VVRLVASPEEDNHESPRTLARLPAAGRATKLYDRTDDAIRLNEIEGILSCCAGRAIGAGFAEDG
jgi:hypothetical protein